MAEFGPSLNRARGCAARQEEAGTVADVHHFTYGWINPTLAYVMSFLGSLLALLLAARARENEGASRGRWLVLAAIALGGTGIWMMHFMAMIGFDVPESVVRYDPWLTAGSFVVAIVIVSLGLFTVCLGDPSIPKIIVGGIFTGIGIAAMHYLGMAAMRVSGEVTYDRSIQLLSVLIAVVASTVALWFAVVIHGAGATLGAALLMGVAVCSMHYTGMASVQVRLLPTTEPITGISAFELLGPISVLACVVISVLAYSTIGFAVRQENAREEAYLADVREVRHAAHAAHAAPAAHAARAAHAAGMQPAHAHAGARHR
jgi:NO-binding membrane sensor protein with MHYT domain